MNVDLASKTKALCLHHMINNQSKSKQLQLFVGETIAKFFGSKEYTSHNTIF